MSAELDELATVAHRRRMAVASRQATRTAVVGLVLLVLWTAAVTVLMSLR